MPRACSSSRSCSSTGSASRTWARTSRIASPTTRPATACGARARRSAAAAVARGHGHRLRRAAAVERVLRFRRHVRDQERRHLDRDAERQGARDPRHRRRGLHRGRQLVPDAHRRRALAPADGRAHDAPGGDPRREARPRPDEPALEQTSRTPPGPRSPTRSCGATFARRRTRSAPSARRRWPRRATGSSCARPAARSRNACCAISTTTCSSSRPPSSAPAVIVHWARDAAEANTNRRRSDRLARRRRGDQVEVAHDRGDRAQRGARRARDPCVSETDLAQLIVQLGNDTPSHILVPAIHKNRAEIRELFLRTLDDVDPGLSDEPRALAEAARVHLRRRFLDAHASASAEPTSPSRRRAASRSSNPKATGAWARRCPRS